jgi:signal transduction histidine kinase/ActR/RegA family two-component response regulator
VASLRSVTDLIETRQAHAQVTSRLRDIARLSGAWFFELDAGLRLSYVSAAMARALGREAEHQQGMSVSELPVRMADPARRDQPVAALFAPPHAPLERAMLCLGFADGRRRIVQITASPFRDDSGAFAGYRGHASEVTDIIRARDQADRASRAKSVFPATMSHELRTPLTAIVGLAELAAAEGLPEGLRSHLDKIRAQGLRLSRLLSDLLDVAAMDQGRPILHAAPFDPVQLVDAVVQPARRTAADKGLDFALDLIAPRPTARLGDAARFGTILRALISNAVEFTLAGEVTVRLDLADPAQITLAVCDTGIGMSEAERAAAVLPFVQGDDGIARRFEGAGLGLSIVTWLTGAMDGRFELTSTPGQGTTARVSLPLPEVARPVARLPPATPAPSAAAPPQPPPPPAEAPLDGRKVMVTDDNLANRKILQALLARMGAQVRLCTDGPEALQAWQRDRFDLVLLDINMPRMAGTEAMQAIRNDETVRRDAPVPTLAVTANARPEQLAQYRRAGFDGCVAKPFTRAQLTHALVRHVEAAAR